MKLTRLPKVPCSGRQSVPMNQRLKGRGQGAARMTGRQMRPASRFDGQDPFGLFRPLCLFPYSALPQSQVEASVRPAFWRCCRFPVFFTKKGHLKK